MMKQSPLSLVHWSVGRTCVYMQGDNLKHNQRAVRTSLIQNQDYSPARVIFHLIPLTRRLVRGRLHPDRIVARLGRHPQGLGDPSYQLGDAPPRANDLSDQDKAQVTSLTSSSRNGHRYYSSSYCRKLTAFCSKFSRPWSYLITVFGSLCGCVAKIILRRERSLGLFLYAAT